MGMQEILISYIKGELAEGKSKDVIEQQLLKSGYEAHQIETAFSMIDHEAEEPDSVPLSTDAQVAQLMQRHYERSLLNTIFMSPLNRSWFIIASAAEIFIFYFVYVFGFSFSQQAVGMGGGAGVVPGILFYISLFLTPVITLNIVVRRLHYLGESGWRAFFIFIPIVGTVFFIYLIAKSDSYNSLR